MWRESLEPRKRLTRWLSWILYSRCPTGETNAGSVSSVCQHFARRRHWPRRETRACPARHSNEPLLTASSSASPTPPPAITPYLSFQHAFIPKEALLSLLLLSHFFFFQEKSRTLAHRQPACSAHTFLINAVLPVCSMLPRSLVHLVYFHIPAYFMVSYAFFSLRMKE